MFKRRNPYDPELPVATYSSQQPSEALPPRIYDRVPEQPSPYRTPAQAYPQAQEPHVVEPPKEEMWTPPAVEEPETVLGEGISIKGNLQFQRFLRVDGEFEGDLDSEGKIVVGPTGVVRANIKLREAIIEGRVEGDIIVTGRCELRGDAKVFGNITARLLSVDEGVSIRGQVNIGPLEGPEAVS
jgi:cytoskeletal protein CcmA (bactofilin family)